MSRTRCLHCDFIVSRCICQSLIPVDSPIVVLIIQFPKEKKHPLNTVNILKKNLSNLHVFEEEKIDDNPHFLQVFKLLKNPVLIFKNENAKAIETVNINELKQVDGIIIIDGSWDKAKRIYFQSKILQQLKTYSLFRPILSEYKIRKSPFKEGLSTIESVSYTLEKLTNDQKYKNLLIPFHQMIQDQIDKMGPDIYSKFYSK